MTTPTQIGTQSHAMMLSGNNVLDMKETHGSGEIREMAIFTASLSTLAHEMS
jgi:hypothetical protein